MLKGQLTVTMKVLRDINGKRVAKFTLANETEFDSVIVVECLGTENGLSINGPMQIDKPDFPAFQEHISWMIEECDRIFAPEVLAPKTYTVDIGYKPKKKTKPTSQAEKKRSTKLNDQRHNPNADLTKYPPEVYNVAPPTPVAGGFDQQGIGVFTNIDKKDHDEYGKKGVIGPMKEEK